MKYSIATVLGLSLIAAAAPSKAAALLGNPYTPTGANYKLTAVQGIDASTPLGKSGLSPQVNRDFEFQNTLGVAYDKGNGTLTQFGLGLYANAAGQVQSTGLNISFNSLVSASSVSIVLADFDIKSDATFFNPNKVEPSLLLFGANNSIYASANPTDIFKSMSPTTGAANEDYWTLDFSKLLTQLGKADTSISGFLLYADSQNGERPNSDPYFITSVSGGIPMIPEPRTYLGGLVLVGLLIGTHARSVMKNRRATADL